MLPDGKCIVRYTDYGNEEEQVVRNLLRPQKPSRQVNQVSCELSLGLSYELVSLFNGLSDICYHMTLCMIYVVI